MLAVTDPDAAPSVVSAVEFHPDGSAIVRRTDGTERLIDAWDVPEVLLTEQRERRERDAARAAQPRRGHGTAIARVFVTPVSHVGTREECDRWVSELAGREVTVVVGDAREVVGIVHLVEVILDV